MSDPKIKNVPMILPEIEDCSVKHNYRTKSEFVLYQGKIGSFYREGAQLISFSAEETRLTTIHPQIVSDIAVHLEGILREYEGNITFRSAGNVQNDAFIVSELLIII